MKRDLYQFLLKWQRHPRRIPLIVRGARQVGKTFLIEQFGAQEFKNFLTINFEAHPAFKECFHVMDPKKILHALEILSNKKISPGKTLLFLDEIQACPQALQALRYFKETLPELHVIAAGSLLEFAIQEENFSFPVGRVQFVKLYPLSFGEYLEAIGVSTLREELSSFTIEKPPTEAVHHHLLQHVQDYYAIGGMPAAVMTHIQLRSFLEVQYTQRAIWETYESDFAKYAPLASHRHLRKLFQEVPRLVSTHIKYSRIDPEIPNPARDIKKAIETLHLAGLFHPILATSAGEEPLVKGLKEKIFKLLFLDIGLLYQASGVKPHHLGAMTGPLAEQFVGQELLASGDPILEAPLYFWARGKGEAEVDYLLAQNGTIYPIEVKAGTWGKLRSLRLFLTEKKREIGVKISQEPLQKHDDLLSIPFYLTAHLPRLLADVQK